MIFDVCTGVLLRSACRDLRRFFGKRDNSMQLIKKQDRRREAVRCAVTGRDAFGLCALFAVRHGK